MKRRIDIIEEIPDMTDDHSTNLVFGYDAVDHQAESHQHPGKIRGRENQDAEEAETGVRVTATPNIHQAGGKGCAQKWKREERGKKEKRGHGVEEQPRETSGGSTRRFFEKARVSLQEEDME